MTSTSPDSAAPSILVVDDEISARSLLRASLEHRGYTVLEAENGFDAMDLVTQQPPDLVILDVMMPGMSGLEMLQQIRQHHSAANLPVILLTALGDTNDVVRGLELGATDYMTKPVDMNVLIARVRIQLRTKRLHDQTSVGMAELQERDVLKDKFMQIAAHDLKSPLGTMTMGLQILADATNEVSKVIPEYERILNMMEFATTVMQSIIDDYLDLQTIKAGRLELDLMSVNLNRQIKGVMDQLETYAVSKGIALQAELDPSLPPCPGDPDRLTQVINNLINNAIKFSPQGSTVLARSIANGGSIRVEVSDQGPGIPEAERPQLFQEFARISNHPTGGEKSSGVGLAISRYLIEAHEGQIGVESTQGYGSTFWFELPL